MEKRLLGMSSLRKIQRRDCCYVDKTDHARRLVEGGDFSDPDFVRRNVEDQLAETERPAGLEPCSVEASVRFRCLIRALHERTGRQAVVLVDEYDKPDALGDPELARANRDFLRSLYGAIKACDRHLRFVFLTG